MIPTGDQHSLTGRWAPNLLLDTATGPIRLAELTRNGRPLLVDLTEGTSLSDELSGWRDRVDVVAARPAATDSVAALLLRPDGYLAWATSDPRPTDLRRLRTALHTWFGPARMSVHA